MALVEGFCEEILQLFGTLFIGLLIAGLIVLLWMSTEVTEIQYFYHTAYTLDTRHDNIRIVPSTPVQSMSENPTSDTVPVNSTFNNDNPENENENSSPLINESTTQSSKSSQSTYDAINKPQKRQDTIKIRLKYLNDDCRLVEGKLQENVGVFRRRHFSKELSSNKIIRLIFKGKIMHDDEASLSSCGLHDNCVVHCVIHQPRPSTNAQQTPDPLDHDTTEQPTPNITRQGQRQPGHVQREWNLERLLSILTIAIIILSLLRYGMPEISFTYCSITLIWGEAFNNN